MSAERWRWVVGYEGIYMVSNLGNVMSVPCVVKKSNGIEIQIDGRILQPSLTRKGYPQVQLTKNGKSTPKRVHRLVAESFIPNKKELPSVNHIDEDKANNTVGNLEWCDVEYNNGYGTRNKRISRKLGKAVLMMKNGETIREYPSVSAAFDITGISTGHISECCNGKRKTAGGYNWKYKEKE